MDQQAGKFADVTRNYPETLKQLWRELYDPYLFAGGITQPHFLVNGTLDPFFQPPEYQRTQDTPVWADRVKGPAYYRLTPTMKHNHEAGWGPAEIAHFVEYCLAGEQPFPDIGRPAWQPDGTVRTRAGTWAGASGSYYFTTSEGVWYEKTWVNVPAVWDQGIWIANLPTDTRACVFSYRHLPMNLEVTSAYTFRAL
jgi:hypothetical protein